MSTSNPRSTSMARALAVLLITALAAGCGSNGTGHRSPILGIGGSPELAPAVTATIPADGATSVPSSTTAIVAAFNEPVAPFTGGASFTVTAGSGPNPAGTVALDPTGTKATFTLAGSTTLAVATTYTATLTGVTSLGTGLAMASPYVWTFSTSAIQDTTRPAVAFTAPATSISGPTAGVPANSAIAAAFTKPMNPATLTPLSFTVTTAAPGLVPAGTVSYAAASQTATFTPTVALAVGTTYTATITTSVTDLAGNALGGNLAPLPAASAYVWTFTTVAPVAAAPVVVHSTVPLAGAVSVSPTAAVNATFGIPSGFRMDPSTVNAVTFTLEETAPVMTPVPAASVVLDPATGGTATFTPLASLTDGATYTATIQGGSNGVKDLAIPGNAMATSFQWSFTVKAGAGNGPAPVVLGSIATFGSFGGSAGTTNMGLKTVINGDIGTTAVSTLITGFHDAGVGDTYTETPLNKGFVNGKIYTAPPAPTVSSTDEGNAATFAIATQARADGLAAYNTLVADPAGADPGAGSLANLVLAPGVYTAAGGSFMIEGGPLTLDAKGDTNAVWVFQMATSLTVGGPGVAFPQSVLLINGAQAKNVFWQVGSAATINAGGGGTMVGTIISQAGAAFSTAGNVTVVTLNGRVLSLGASVTLVNTIVNVPAN